MKTQSFFGGVAVLFFGGVLAKVLGAFYKIPLTWILGTEGLGLYQLVFPLFSMLLIISSTGMPTAISQIVSKHKNRFIQNQILKCSLKFLILLSLFVSVVLFFMARFVAFAQGSEQIYILYWMICPAIVFVGVVSAFRGYFQGKLNMIPTTASILIEQFFKLALGLSLAYALINYGVLWGTFGAVVGVVFSELIAMLFLVFYYTKHGRAKIDSNLGHRLNLTNKKIYALLIKTATPVIVLSLIIPFSLVLDSFLVVNILKHTGFSQLDSISLWGISTGVVNTLINLPVAICLCVATALVPFLSGDTEGKVKKQEKVYDSFFIVNLIALPCAVLFFVLPDEILEFLYGGNLGISGINQPFIATNLLKLSCPLVVLICILQTQTAILQGHKMFYTPIVNLCFAVALKTVTLVFAVKAFSIYGVALASLVLYGCVVVLNMVTIKSKLGLKMFSKNLFSVFAALLAFTICALVLKNMFVGVSVYISLPFVVVISGVVFAFCLACLNVQGAKIVFIKCKEKVYNRFFGKKFILDKQKE